MILLFAFLIGVIAGLRAMMAPAFVSVAASFYLIDPITPLDFLYNSITVWIFGIAAVCELINDKRPKTIESNERNIQQQFIVRIVTGALSGAAIGASWRASVGGLIAGGFGAAAGRFGEAWCRGRLVAAIGDELLPNDHRLLRISAIEDVVAILGGLLILRYV